MKIAFDQMFGDMFGILFKGGFGTALLKDLINIDEKSFADGGKILFVDIFFEGGKDTVNDSCMFLSFRVMFCYFVHFGYLIFGDLFCSGEVVIDGCRNHCEFIRLRHLRYEL